MYVFKFKVKKTQLFKKAQLNPMTIIKNLCGLTNQCASSFCTDLHVIFYPPVGILQWLSHDPVVFFFL